MMGMFENLFKVKIPVIGVIHLSPLPGSPLYNDSSVEQISKQAVSEAKIMVENGINGLIVENFGDKLFLKKVGPEVVSAMTYIAKEVKDNVDVPIGLCVLQSDAIAGIAISKTVGADFIRIPYYVETSIVDAGMMESIAAEALRYRKYLGVDVKFFADVHIKHSYPLAQRRIEYSAEDAYYRGLADAIIITGRKTGGETNPSDVIRVRNALPEVPLVVGSGVSIENVDNYLPYVDAIIVVTSLNKGGKVEEVPDPDRITAFMKKIEDYRNNL
ncbi:MAG: membrane biogenesis protein [Thermotoga sp.]|nr:MAG: membrane biogenesis protein [Thermotoga sp.]